MIKNLDVLHLTTLQPTPNHNQITAAFVIADRGIRTRVSRWKYTGDINIDLIKRTFTDTSLIKVDDVLVYPFVPGIDGQDCAVLLAMLSDRSGNQRTYSAYAVHNLHTAADQKALAKYITEVCETPHTIGTNVYEPLKHCAEAVMDMKQEEAAVLFRSIFCDPRRAFVQEGSDIGDEDQMINQAMRVVMRLLELNGIDKITHNAKDCFYATEQLGIVDVKPIVHPDLNQAAVKFVYRYDGVLKTAYRADKNRVLWHKRSMSAKDAAVWLKELAELDRVANEATEL